MSDEICTREFVRIVKIEEGRTYHPVRESSGCPPHALFVAGAVEGENIIQDSRKI